MERSSLEREAAVHAFLTRSVEFPKVALLAHGKRKPSTLLKPHRALQNHTAVRALRAICFRSV